MKGPLLNMGPCAGENDSQRGDEPPLLQPGAATGRFVGHEAQPRTSSHSLWPALRSSSQRACECTCVACAGGDQASNFGDYIGEFAAELENAPSPQHAASCRGGRMLWQGCLYLCTFPLLSLCAAIYVHVWTSPALQLLKTNKHMKHPHLRGSLEYIKGGMGISCVLAWQC